MSRLKEILNEYNSNQLGEQLLREIIPEVEYYIKRWKDLIDCYDAKNVLEELQLLRQDIIDECDDISKIVGAIELAEKIKKEDQ